jgi:1,4-dihydroxy-2-naphthoate octaprenyltransferase
MRALVLTHAFIRLGRPLFLGGGFILYALGAAVAGHFGHPLDARAYVLGQAVVTSLQLMTHYANDYFDYEADVANTTPTRWSGGSRVLPGGEIPRVAALIAALLLAAMGVFFGLLLELHVGTRRTTVPLLLAILVLSWTYSAPPLRLHSRGVGELDVAIVVTTLVPLLGFWVQAPDLVGLRVLLLAIVPPFLLQVAMTLAIEFPDYAGDRATGKRTLVVRLGPARAAKLFALVTAAPFLLLPLLVLAGLPRVVAGAAAVLAPVAAWRLVRIARRDWELPQRWEALTFWAVALLVATSLVELVAFVFLV